MNIKPEVAEMVRRWVSKADSDLRAAALLLDAGGPYDIAAYHCEQAAERSLKAILTTCGIHAPRTHDIGHMHELLPLECRLPIPNGDLEYLSAYGIDSWWDPDRVQALKAFQIARTLRDQVLERLPEEVLA